MNDQSELDRLCSRLSALYLPAVCDAMYELGIPETVLSQRLRPLDSMVRIVGAAHTLTGAKIDPPVSWDEGLPRMEPYLEVFERLRPNSIMVSVTQDGSEVGHFGELTANAAKARGCRGVILDGNLRDVQGLRDIGFQVFYSALSPLNGIGRWEMVAEQTPVVIDGVTINPGDIILAEFEGILVIPRAQAEAIASKAEHIAGAEQLVRDEASEGVPPITSLARHGHI